jgi:hypothetical protein
MRWVHIGAASALVTLIIVVGIVFIGSDSTTISETHQTLNLQSVAGVTGSSVRPPQNRYFSQSNQTDLPGPKRLAGLSSDGWAFLAFVALSLATLIATATSFYLYRWRRILLSEPHLVVPEQFGAWVKRLDKHVVDLTDGFSNGIKIVSQKSSATDQKMTDLFETFMTFQQALDEREAEIRRLKRGYDAEVFRKFVSRFIRVDQLVDDLQKAGEVDADGLEQVRRLLEDAFLECGVEAFQPEIGSDYREAHGVADNPKSVAAENPEDAFMIKEIIESGYQIRHGESCQVIIPAKVVIHVV